MTARAPTCAASLFYRPRPQRSLAQVHVRIISALQKALRIDYSTKLLSFISKPRLLSAGRRLFFSMETPFDVTKIRAVYRNSSEPHLIEAQLSTREPFTLFDQWFKNVASISNLSFEEVNAVCLSTVSSDLRPSSRMVLLKAYDSEGFSFYTHKTSKKGRQMTDNPNAAMLFYWPAVHRQIRIEGTITELPVEDAVAYWNSRPVASRIGSKSSNQSTVCTREDLHAKRSALQKLSEDEGPEAITKPEAWLGFKLVPRYFEFWQGQSDRLHDRIVFDKEAEHGEDVGAGWHMYRVSP